MARQPVATKSDQAFSMHGRLSRLETLFEQTTSNVNRLTDDVRSIAESLTTLAKQNQDSLNSQTQELKSEIASVRDRSVSEFKDRSRGMPMMILGIISVATTILIVYINSAVGPVFVAMRGMEDRTRDLERHKEQTDARERYLFERVIRLETAREHAHAPRKPGNPE